MPFAGQLEMFDPEIHLWSRYLKRLKNFLIATKVEDKLVLPTVFTLLGDKTYSVVCDLFSPEDPDEKSCQEVFDKLSEHFSPKIMIPVERFHFSQRKQRKDESISEFALALRNLSKNCRYGVGMGLEERLCEQFVFGLYDPEIRTRLLFEEELPFDLAIKIAIGVESAKKGTSTFASSTSSSEGLYIVKPSSHCKPTKLRSDKACKHCGDFSHDADKCKYKDYICNVCKKKGHLAKICRSRTVKNKRSFDKKRSDTQIKSIQEENNFELFSPNTTTEDFSGNDVIEYDFNRVNIRQFIHTGNQPIMLEFFVNNKKITFELDTGAGVTLISENLYLQKLSSCKLMPTAVMLNTISQQVKPLGKIIVSASYNHTIRNSLEIFVIRDLSVPLLGRSWITKFNILNPILQKSVSSIKISQNQIQLGDILKKYSKLFSPKLGELKGFEAHLTLRTDYTPKFCKYRPIPFALKSAVELELQKLQNQGILTPVQHSDWAAPIVPILKKDNTIRLCGDYKVGLNPALLIDSYPLPRIEDIFTMLNGGIIFSKLDMAQAYQQLRMDEESQLLLTINTHKGLFKVRRMPFGISPAPSIFQRMMDQVLAGLTGVVCYLDDILITGRSISEHLNNLEKVLERLLNAGITLNKFKCEFLKDRVEYLGHIIDAEGLHASTSKISGITEAPAPKDVSQLRSFLGLASYYRKFLPDLASTLAPLNKLLQKETKWKWDNAADKAFNRIKDAIISPKVLVYLDPKLPISLACDASPTGLGAIISHIYPDGSDKPIAFASRSLSQAERNYSQLDKEALGIIFGVKKFHQYLFGKKFILLTDHKPLTRIFAPDAQIPTLAAARLQRWSLILTAYDYEIRYRSSASHLNADALSRSPNLSINYISLEEKPNDLFMLNYLETSPVTAKMIAQGSIKDPILSRVMLYVKDGWKNHCSDKELIPFFSRKAELSLLNGCLLWGLRVIIPADLQCLVLTELHKDHVGIVKMKMLARCYFWWPNLDQAIENIAKSCTECAQHANTPPKATVHPWVWPSRPWERVHLDFAGPFMGHNFLVAVDAHSKWPEVTVMNSITAEKTISVLQNLLARYGLPEHLVTDNGTQFTSQEFEIFCKKYGIKHTFSAPYHPATNGQAEKFVQTLKRFLKKKANENSTVIEKLNQLLLSYRSTPNIATHQTPALLFLRREMRTRLDLMRPSVETTVRKYQERMLPSQKKPVSRQFQVGQKVFAKDYFGPHKWVSAVVTERKGPLSYVVKLLNGKHWRRHVDQLREFSSTEGEERIVNSQKIPNLMILPELNVKPRKITMTPDITDNLECLEIQEPPNTETQREEQPRRYPIRKRRPPNKLLPT